MQSGVAGNDRMLNPFRKRRNVVVHPLLVHSHLRPVELLGRAAVEDTQW